MNSASNGWSGTRFFDALLFRQSYLATSPGTTHVDHSISEIDVLPLQAKAFRYPESCARSQERKSSFRLAEVGHDCICLFGGENHRFVSAGCPAADKIAWDLTPGFAELDRIFGHAYTPRT